MYQSIELLRTFSPISLKEMGSVKLMDRTDTKFTISISHLFDILDTLKDSYLVVEIDGKRIAKYSTLYYDTEQLNLYAKHHNGLNSRYKIRHRTYVDSNIGFLEIKFKTNKGRTIKTRIDNLDVPKEFESTSNPTSFLEKELPFSPSSLIPTVYVNYRRITLVNLFTQERVTIDVDLEFIKKTTKKQMAGLVIIEVKQDGKQESAFLNLMKEKKIKPGSISKYCMAVAITDSTIKQNNFKKKLLSINKIISNSINKNIN